MIFSKVFQNKKILILGLGITGLNLYKALKKSSANVYVWDDNIKIKNIGIRPGEKIHEQMIGLEDAPYTYDYEDFARGFKFRVKANNKAYNHARKILNVTLPGISTMDKKFV